MLKLALYTLFVFNDRFENYRKYYYLGETLIT